MAKILLKLITIVLIVFMIVADKNFTFCGEAYPIVHDVFPNGISDTLLTAGCQIKLVIPEFISS